MHKGACVRESLVRFCARERDEIGSRICVRKGFVNRTCADMFLCMNDCSRVGRNTTTKMDVRVLPGRRDSCNVRRRSCI
eukprot:3254661-Pleurochrysis_carterae.AAC.2